MTHTYIYICIYTYTLLHVGTTVLHHSTRSTWIQGFVPQCGSTAALVGVFPNYGITPEMWVCSHIAGALPIYGEPPHVWGDCLLTVHGKSPHYLGRLPTHGDSPHIWEDFPYTPIDVVPCWKSNAFFSLDADDSWIAVGRAARSKF